MPTWITQEKLNSDQNETDPFGGSAVNGKDGGMGGVMLGPGVIGGGSRSNVPIAETRKWEDLSMNELLGKFADESQ